MGETIIGGMRLGRLPDANRRRAVSASDQH
jgi:hypothetical protein